MEILTLNRPVTLQAIEGVSEEEWESLVAIEGKWTDDGRLFSEGALTWRDQEVAVKWIRTEEGHERAVRVATATRFERRDDEIWAFGTYDTSEEASVFKQAIAQDEAGWPSIEIGDVGENDVLIGVDERGNTTLEFTRGKITGFAIVQTPALEGTFFRNKSLVPEILAAAAPVLPPKEWFMAELTEPTPITVTDEGRIFGHAALWNTCHISYPDACLEPPRTQNDYAYFLTGEIDTDEGPVSVGQIVVGTDHAPLSLKGLRAADHYAHTGTAVADVFIGEDEWGPWVAGAVRPDATAEQIRVLKASSLSGDWRRLGGSLELVALLAVNTPGYPVPRRQAFVASGRQESLIMSEAFNEESRIEALERTIKPLALMALDREMSAS